MLCENCGENKANVKYTQIINGEKQEMHLCEKCSEKLGINNIDFKMPIDFSSFFGDVLEEFETKSFLPEINNTQILKCNNCGLSFDEFLNIGKFGCSKCYDAFDAKITPILKNIHGSSKHVGRLGKINKNVKLKSVEDKSNVEIKEDNKLKDLKIKLKTAIKEERYEDAAKLRDEIKKLEN